MKGSVYLGKKTVQDIFEQEKKKMETDGHNALGRHLTARDLTAFGIAARRCRYISTISKSKC
jgi:hypothetical protein